MLWALGLEGSGCLRHNTVSSSSYPHRPRVGVVSLYSIDIMYFSLAQKLTRLIFSAILIIGLNLLSGPLALAASMSGVDFPVQRTSAVFSPLPIFALHLARLDQHQEAPGKILYKAFVTLHDQNGQVWRAIAFNHVLPDGRHNFKLRLVGFPGSAAVDRTKPLHIKTALGQSFITPDDSANIASDEGMAAIDVPPNVAQYDLEAIAPHLASLVPLRLTLPLKNDDVRLLILPNVVQEWKSVAFRAQDLG